MSDRPWPIVAETPPLDCRAPMSLLPCPHCGELVEEDAVACPHCGSDSETGWNPDVDYYSVELPEEGRERGAARRELRRGGRLIILTAVITGLLFLFSLRGAGDAGSFLKVFLALLFGISLVVSVRGPRRH